jgi:hypothetical protein
MNGTARHVGPVKSVVFPAAAVVAVGGWMLLLAGCNSPEGTPPADATPTSGEAALGHRLTVDFGSANRPPIIWSAAASRSGSVLDLLLEAAREEDFTVHYQGAGASAFVKAIDGVEGGSNGSDWWIFYVNGELADRGAGVFPLQAGDKVEWRLGRYEPASNSEENRRKP